LGLMSLPREMLSPAHLQVDEGQATPQQEMNSGKSTWPFRVGLGFVCLAVIAVSAWAVLPQASHSDWLPGSEGRSRHSASLAFLPTMPALKGGVHPNPSRVMTPRARAFGRNPSRAVIPQAVGSRLNPSRAVIRMSAATMNAPTIGHSATVADLLELPVPKIAEKLSLRANKYAETTGFEDLVLASSDTAKIIDKACAYAAPSLNQDRWLGSKDIDLQRALESVYKALAARNILRGFGSCSNALIPLENKANFTDSDQETATGLSPTAWAPQRGLPIAGRRVQLPWTTIAAVAYGYAGFSFLPILAGVALDNLVFKGTLGDAMKRTVTPGFNEMVLEREAGRFLVAYLLGNPVQACLLDPLGALKARDISQRPGTAYFDPELGQKNGIKRGELLLSRTCLDRSSIVMMSGVAADAMNGKTSELSIVDGGYLGKLLSELNADTWDAARIESQARWGAVQAYLLLRDHESAYRALCKALSEGSSIGEAVMVIEGALAQDADLPALKRKKAQMLVESPSATQLVI